MDHNGYTIVDKLIIGAREYIIGRYQVTLKYWKMRKTGKIDIVSSTVIRVTLVADATTWLEKLL